MSETIDTFEKKNAYDNRDRAECGATMAMGANNKYVPPTLRESLDKRLEHAKAEGDKAWDLKQLCALLDNHPEVAMILDLIEKVGKY
jgi:hypothetical protein